MKELEIDIKEETKSFNFLKFIDYKEVDRWAVESLGRIKNIESRFK